MCLILKFFRRTMTKLSLILILIIIFLRKKILYLSKLAIDMAETLHTTTLLGRLILLYKNLTTHYIDVNVLVSRM